jgi:hypothetical protein
VRESIVDENMKIFLPRGERRSFYYYIIRTHRGVVRGELLGVAFAWVLWGEGLSLGRRG